MDGNQTANPGHPEYWWGEDSAVTILSGLRRFRHADQEMRRRISEGMSMNETDLRALQVVIAAGGARTPVTPRDLATALGISTASTTKLLDRLTVSGHLERQPHPSDRRSLVVTATDHAHTEVRERLTAMHDAMLELARAVPAEARSAVVTFLNDMADLMDAQEPPEPLRPKTRG